MGIHDLDVRKTKRMYVHYVVVETTNHYSFLVAVLRNRKCLAGFSGVAVRFKAESNYSRY